MFNIIFQMSLDAQQKIIASRPEDGGQSPAEQFFHSLGAVWAGNLSDCRITDEGRVAYTALVPDMQTAWVIHQSIRELDPVTQPIVVGAWDCATGMQQGWSIVDAEAIYTPQADEIIYNFDIVAYKDMLRDIVVYDEDGNEFSRRRPTTDEARKIQVTTFAGMPKRRDLEAREVPE